MPAQKTSKMRLYFVALGCSLFIMGLGQWMLSLGRDFIDGQQPIDWAHWFILVGAVGIALSSVKLSFGMVGKIASALIVAGAIALTGMAAIDILLWTVAETPAVDTALDEALDSPGIAIPFLWVGPSLLFIGLALKSIEWWRWSSWSAALLFLGTLVCGYGQAVSTRLVVVAGIAMMLLGVIGIYRAYAAKPLAQK